MLEQKKQSPEAVNSDEPDCWEGWTDCPEMVLKVPPKAVLTWALGKKGKKVKALQLPLKGHLKKTSERTAKDTRINEQTPYGETKPLSRTAALCVATKPVTAALYLPQENAEPQFFHMKHRNLLRTPKDTSISIK